MSAGPLAFSLLAHEAPEVLLGQLRNIRHHNPDCRIVLHLSAPFRAALGGSAALEALVAEPGLLLNPESLETGWAHIFHAHLSNMRLLRESGWAPSHLVLLSSGDLFFRSGLAEHLAEVDAAVGQTPAEAAWGEGHTFRPRLDADAKALALRAATPDGRWRHGMHEGSAFRWTLLLELLQAIEAAGRDWTDVAGYPREEIVLPTLVAARPGLRLARPAAQTLGTDEPRPGWQREIAAMAVRAAVTEAELADPAQARLAAWLAENTTGQPLPKVHAVARVPRDPANALRRLLLRGVGGAPAPLPPVEPLDLVEFDLPGRTNRDRHLQPLSATTAAAILRRAQPLNWLAALEPLHHEIDLPECLGGQTHEIVGLLRVPGCDDPTMHPFLVGIGLPEPLTVRMQAGEGTLALSWEPVDPPARIVLGLPLPEAAWGADHVLVGVAGTDEAQDPGPRLQIQTWIGAAGQPGRLAATAGRPTCLTNEGGEATWLLQVATEGGSARLVLRLAASQGLGSIRLTLLSWLSAGRRRRPP